MSLIIWQFTIVFFSRIDSQYSMITFLLFFPSMSQQSALTVRAGERVSSTLVFASYHYVSPLRRVPMHGRVYWRTVREADGSSRDTSSGTGSKSRAATKRGSRTGCESTAGCSRPTSPEVVGRETLSRQKTTTSTKQRLIRSTIQR